MKNIECECGNDVFVAIPQYNSIRMVQGLNSTENTECYHLRCTVCEKEYKFYFILPENVGCFERWLNK